jgi:hypothetical protein
LIERFAAHETLAKALETVARRLDQQDDQRQAAADLFVARAQLEEHSKTLNAKMETLGAQHLQQLHEVFTILAQAIALADGARRAGEELRANTSERLEALERAHG